VASLPAWTSCSCLSRSSCSRRCISAVVSRKSPMMWIMAFRWLARRLLNSFRSPMMWSIARRWSSRCRRRRSSVSTWARSPLAAGGGELARFLGADEAGERLLEDLVVTEAEELGDGVVSLQHLALEVGNENGVGDVLDEALGIGARFVELPHVAQDADGADHL